ncbi:hypothetical protein BVIR_2672 [Blastochloris viridis]|uniref:Uncharacterized protein n=2 Tax=Blastochloris viridis TaxID=1079 RepID=A0A0H5BGV9_BLAVI|nr:hypothetical protein BVIR_2672 [Blastochloris viridis]BAR99621.1 hypothetical protein BV133_2028 [Blastochloris viridis]CUU43099.1 hypothetical protein BVIRIDIS_21160 [Blastochloris viridis]
MFSETTSSELSASDRLVSIAEMIAAHDRTLLIDAADHMLGIAEHLAELGDQSGAERIFNALEDMVAAARRN